MTHIGQPLVHFTGLVIGKIADNDGRGPCLIICSASRVEKQVKPILIHLHSGKKKTDIFNGIAPGQILTGSFYYAGQAIKALLSTSVETIAIYENDPALAKPAPRFPSLGRKIIQEAFQVLHINAFLSWQWISKYHSYPEFTRLINDKLKQPGSSLVSLDFTGMVTRKIPKSEIKRKVGGKEYLCVACNEDDSFELPLLTSIRIPNGALQISAYHPKKGSIFTATRVPILNVYPEDGMNILRCGQTATIQEILLPERNNLLPYFYDTIADMLWGRELFWPVFFPSRRIPDNLGAILERIREEMRASGISPQPKVHGWFGRGWFFYKAIKPEESGIPGITIYMATFSGNPEINPHDLEKSLSKWPNIETVGDMIKYYFPRLPARIIIVPANEPRFSIKEKGCSISLSPTAEIQEGSFIPDPPTWKLIQAWIWKNYQQLASNKWDDKAFIPV